jgi:hypothetical protein
MKTPPAPRNFRRFAATLALLASLLTLCSCVDLAKVNEFAKASQAAGAAFKAIADEGSLSCERAADYAKKTGLEAPDCTFYATVAPGLIKINDALFAYIAGLGKLASADPSKVADGLKDVPGQLKLADPKISADAQSKAKSATGLATALAKVLTSEYRQHALAKVVEEANGDADHPGPIKDVIAFLSDYAAEKYDQGLREERNYEMVYHTRRVRDFAASEPLALELFERQYQADLARIELNRAAIAKYRQALAAIASAHQKLYDSRKAWNAKQLATILAPEILQLADAGSSMKTAF